MGDKEVHTHTHTTTHHVDIIDIKVDSTLVNSAVAVHATSVPVDGVLVVPIITHQWKGHLCGSKSQRQHGEAAWRGANLVLTEGTNNTRTRCFAILRYMLLERGHTHVGVSRTGSTSVREDVVVEVGSVVPINAARTLPFALREVHAGQRRFATHGSAFAIGWDLDVNFMIHQRLPRPNGRVASRLGIRGVVFQGAACRQSRPVSATHGTNRRKLW